MYVCIYLSRKYSGFFGGEIKEQETSLSGEQLIGGKIIMTYVGSRGIPSRLSERLTATRHNAAQFKEAA